MREAVSATEYEFNEALGAADSMFHHGELTATQIAEYPGVPREGRAVDRR